MKCTRGSVQGGSVRSENKTKNKRKSKKKKKKNVPNKNTLYLCTLWYKTLYICVLCGTKTYSFFFSSSLYQNSQTKPQTPLSLSLHS